MTLTPSIRLSCPSTSSVGVLQVFAAWSTYFSLHPTTYSGASMELPTTDFAEILRSPKFEVTSLRTRLDRMRAIALRTTDKEGKWHEGILKKASLLPGGLMLFRYPTDKLSPIRVLHLSSADCGTNKPSTRYTASLLYRLGVGVSETAVFTTLQTHSCFHIYNLNPPHHMSKPRVELCE